jgi:hypothetical protein
MPHDVFRVVGEVTPQALRLALAKACESAGGPLPVARRIGVSVSVITRMLSGSRCYRGSIALVRQHLRITDEGAPKAKEPEPSSKEPRR